MTGVVRPDTADAGHMKRLLTSKQHKEKPTELCQTGANLAKLLNWKVAPPHYLQPDSLQHVFDHNRPLGLKLQRFCFTNQLG